MAMDPKQVEDFIQQIKLRAFDDAYIDSTEEKEIYQEAIKNGVDLDRARAFLRQACARFEFAMESELRDILHVVLEQFYANDGKLDMKELEDAAAIGVKLLKRRAPRCTVIAKDVQAITIEICKREGWWNTKIEKAARKKSWPVE